MVVGESDTVGYADMPTSCWEKSNTLSESIHFSAIERHTYPLSKSLPLFHIRLEGKN